MPESTIDAKTLQREVQRRRTFAIISHPDAGKTTLTEKLLLYWGMIRTAGMVGSRKSNKNAASDWMAMEQERGISITASAMQFEYKDTVINILDTPGHQDFSEDTYRTLTAADSVIMVIDAAKGVEAQTRKLFAACRLRGIPVFTFVNKMDMPARDPLELMEEVEQLLEIETSPLTWPIGSGKAFQGIVDLRQTDKPAVVYEKTGVGGSTIPQAHVASLDAHPKLSDEVGQTVRDEIELIAEAGNPFSVERFLRFQVSPVFFGSALTNFGIEPLFDAFIELAPAPSERRFKTADDDAFDHEVDPVATPFSAYIFKMQANMNPKHRDCVAFMRINSGHYVKDMVVKHDRTGRDVRLSRPHTMMVAARDTLEEAYPGDVIGVMNTGQFAIGDSISLRGGITFEPLPYFQPEVFARIQPSDTGKRKQLDKGLEQLRAEGAVQILREWEETGDYPYVAGVGRLQFEVLQYRLQSEYNVETKLTPMHFGASGWLVGDVATFRVPHQAKLVRDPFDRPMVLFSTEWEKEYAKRENPDHDLIDYA